MSQNKKGEVISYYVEITAPEDPDNPESPKVVLGKAFVVDHIGKWDLTQLWLTTSKGFEEISELEPGEKVFWVGKFDKGSQALPDRLIANLGSLIKAAFKLITADKLEQPIIVIGSTLHERIVRLAVNLSVNTVKMETYPSLEAAVEGMVKKLRSEK